MGKPPAGVIIARSDQPHQNLLIPIAQGCSRHGARLDAADKQWYHISPTPYDSRWTYRGWKQAQAPGGKNCLVYQIRERNSFRPH